MDMRTRIERKMDKLMAQKRKNWELEAELKVPAEEPMEWSQNVLSDSEDSPKEDNFKKPITKAFKKPKIETKRKPKVQMSRGKETQTLLQLNGEFQVIGSGRPSLKADSAGHKLDTCYYQRTQERLKIKRALTSTQFPVGALMPMSIAIRIESAIYRVLSQDAKEYVQYCNLCSAFIENKNNQNMRYELLMGQLDPEEFAFIPSVGTDLEALIDMRIKSKNTEQKEKLKQLKKGIV